MARIVPLFMSIVLLAGLGISAGSQPAIAAPDGRVAVVDMLYLINEHPETKALRTTFEARELEATKFLDRSKTRLEKMRKDINLLQGDERRRKQAQFDKQAMWDEYDFKFKVQEARLAYIQELEGIHAAVSSLIASYARRNNISVVLQMTRDTKLRAVDRNDYVMKVALRGVVWYDAQLDITNEIQKQFPKPPKPPAGG